jgi:hypothetical protein
VASLTSQQGSPPLRVSFAQVIRSSELDQTLVASLESPLELVLVELDQLKVSLGRFDLVAYNFLFIVLLLLL